MCVRRPGGGGKLWATLLIFHMLHQCRSSDSVGLAFSQTRAAELSNTLSTFHWGAVHWLCQDKKHCGQPRNFQREHGVSKTSTLEHEELPYVLHTTQQYLEYLQMGSGSFSVSSACQNEAVWLILTSYETIGIDHFYWNLNTGHFLCNASVKNDFESQLKCYNFHYII